VGTVYEQEGRDKEARGAYKEAISLDRGHARALNNMASMSMAQVIKP
jgi:Flp pilus assembly protein TadD